MLIQADAVAELISQYSYFRLLIDGSIDSLMFCSVFSLFARVGELHYLQRITQEEKLDRDMANPVEGQLTIIVNLGQQKSFSAAKQPILLCCTQLPVSIQTVLSPNVWVFDDTTVLIQLMSAFHPRDLRDALQAHTTKQTPPLQNILKQKPIRLVENHSNKNTPTPFKLSGALANLIASEVSNSERITPIERRPPSLSHAQHFRASQIQDEDVDDLDEIADQMEEDEELEEDSFIDNADYGVDPAARQAQMSQLSAMTTTVLDETTAMSIREDEQQLVDSDVKLLDSSASTEKVEAHQLFLTIQPPNYGEHEILQLKNDIASAGQKGLDMVAEYGKMQTTASPIAARLAKAMLQFPSITYDRQNTTFIQKVLFYAFVSMRRALSLGETSIQYIQYFADQLKELLGDSYVEQDVNIPLLRVEQLRRAISYCPLQFIVQPDQQFKGLDFRTHRVLAALGIPAVIATRRYCDLDPKVKKSLIKKLVHVQEKISYPLFAPDFVYKEVGEKLIEVSASDFSVLLEADSNLMFEDFVSIRQKITRELLEKVKVINRKRVEIFDKMESRQSKNIFMLTPYCEIAENEMKPAASFAIQAVVVSHFQLVIRRCQTVQEKYLRKQGVIVDHAAFKETRLRLERSYYEQLETVSAFVLGKRSYLKTNYQLFYGGLLASHWVKAAEANKIPDPIGDTVIQSLAKEIFK